MTVSQSNSPTKTIPNTTFLQPQPSPSTFSSSSTTENNTHKSISLTSTTPEKMAAKSPVEIGTRGTVGSLIMQEIEYFSRLELGCSNGSCKHLQAMASTSSYSGSKVMAPKKKTKGGRKFIPSMCSMVEVAEIKNQPILTSGFGYKNLKVDHKRLQI